jgi:hypothetical protein
MAAWFVLCSDHVTRLTLTFLYSTRREKSQTLPVKEALRTMIHMLSPLATRQTTSLLEAYNAKWLTGCTVEIGRLPLTLLLSMFKAR